MPDHEHDYIHSWIGVVIAIVVVVLVLFAIGAEGVTRDIHERLDALETPVAEEAQP